ncbi:hypothetical protein RHSIM_Rhsim12G0101600 [Rhododendron simsii]|uniref:Uncharacterized protein n=1 Tax=Rhododendron simsii TaxID=118357 RepID=A0A834L5P0_RHOSS|nr:hypothetical protein RHSIM_Rhsim12G0101600 [Rhododendron simsii]
MYTARPPPISHHPKLNLLRGPVADHRRILILTVSTRSGQHTNISDEAVLRHAQLKTRTEELSRNLGLLGNPVGTLGAELHSFELRSRGPTPTHQNLRNSKSSSLVCAVVEDAVSPSQPPLMNSDPKSNLFSELASQRVIQAENEKQQVIPGQNGKQKAAVHIVAQVENGKLKAECDQPQQVSIPNSIEHSTGEELNDFEDELLEVLEGVVSSKQEVEALSQPKAAESLVKPHSELETFPTPEPPDLLDPGVKGESAILYSNGDTGFNKHLSKSTKRRLRKQANSALSSGRN